MLIHDDLRALIHYDPETGEMRWRESRRRVTKGALAGTLNPSRGLIVTIDGTRYYGHRLAWFYVTGEWPEGQLEFRDGDPCNTAWGNLVLKTARPASKATQRIRRYRARLRKENNFYEAKLGPATDATPQGVGYSRTRRLWVCTDPADSRRVVFEHVQEKRAKEWQRDWLQALAWLDRNPPPAPTPDSANIRAGADNSKAARLSLDTLNNLFAYNPKTGHFYHRQGARRGMRADHLNSSGRPVVSTTARHIPAAMLAWFLTHRYWPRPKSIEPKNGNPKDLRLDNLMERTDGMAG